MSFNLKTLGFVALTFLFASNSFGQLVSSTGDTLVNTVTVDDTQQHPAVAMDTNGRYVVVWESEEEDGDGFGIYAKMYDADHNVLVGDFLVNTTSNVDDQRLPDVAISNDGNICIVWQTHEDITRGWDIYRKVYDFTGAVVANRSRVNSSIAGDQMHPTITASDGHFFIVFMNDAVGGEEAEVYGRTYLSSGAATMSATQIAVATGNHLAHPDVDTDGTNIRVVWQEDATDGDRKGIFMASYDDFFTLQSGPTQVNSETTGNQQEPRIAIEDNGDFTVVWSSFDQDGDHFGVYGQSFTAAEATSGAEFQVNTTTSGSQDHVAIDAAFSGSHYVITWTSESGSDGDLQGVYARVLLDGAFTGSTDELINVRENDRQMFSDVAFNKDTSDIVFVWQGGLRKEANGGDDTDDFGVYARAMQSGDTTAPIPVCQNITVYLDATGMATITASDIDGGSTDNIGVTSLVASETDFDCSEVGGNGVILFVYDAAGNSAACGATVTVIDSIPPTALCQDVTVYLDGSGNASITASDLDNGSSDICGTPTLSTSQTAFNCADVGANSITLTATDASGNATSCTSTVTVIDSIPPVAICQDITAYLDASGNAVITGAFLDGGSSDNCGTPTMTASQTTFTCADLGTNNVTVTATDPGGNTSSCTSIVTILDTVAPSAVCQNITVYLDGSGAATISTADIDGGSSDNCGIATYGASITSFNCANIGANNVTLTVTDVNGNTSSCTSTVTVVDSIAPTASCQNVTVYLDGSGTVTITASDLDNGSTDECGSPLLAASQTTFSCVDTGANSITLTATDASGNSSSCTSTVTVIDSTAPTAVCQDITVFLNGSGNATITAGALDGGSSDNCGSVSLTASQTAFTCSEIGVNTVTLTATDASGNTSSCTSTVTIIDSIAPNAVCQDITVYLDGAGTASIVAGDIDGGSTDNCSIVSLAANLTSFTCANVGTNNVTLTVTDASGNVSSCSSTVTVLDSITPVASCQDVTVYLDGSGNASITPGDVDNGSSDNCSIASLSLDVFAFTCANTGANSVILTATDPSGNAASCSSTVTIVDSTAPSAACQDLTVYLDGSGNATITAGDLDNGSTDNCGIPNLTASQTLFTCADVGVNTITLTATDASGNTSTCTSSVTVIDSIAPTASCQNINVYLDGSGLATITGAEIDGGSTDNCGSLTFGTSQSTFTCADIGANTVTLTVTDANGNSATCISTVTVLDSIAPTASCQNITIYLDGAGSASIVAGDIDNGSFDNCSIATLSASQTSFTCANTGTNTVILTATDPSGNAASCTSTVTVVDSTAPTALCQDLTVYLNGSGNATITPSTLDGGSSDNCGTVSFTASQTAFTCTDIGTNTVTLTVTDATGNTSSCTSTVTVIDSIAPTAICQDINVYLDGTGFATITGTDLDGGSMDNCSTPTLTVSQTTFTCAEIGANAVILTVTDAGGNISTCSATVTVLDTLAPTASNAIDTLVMCPSEILVPDPSVITDAADNCSATVTFVSEVYTGTGSGCADTVVRTFNVADPSGNSINVTQTIYIMDTIAPTGSTPSSISVHCAADIPVASPVWVVDAGDNCSTPTVTWVGDVSDGQTCPETISRSYEITDDCGNSTILVQAIFVNDEEVPVLDTTSLPDVVGYCDLTPDTPTAMDECSGALAGVADVAFPINTVGTTVVTWTFTDDCGNSVTQTQNVVVEEINVDTWIANDGITIVSDNLVADSYQWIDCNSGDALPGETNHNFTPTYSSDYAVIITQDGCSDTSDCVTILEVGLTEINSVAIDLNLFPNPTNDGNFSVQFIGDWNGEIIVEVFDSRGRIVFQSETLEEILQISLDSAEQGAYYLRATDYAGASLMRRVIKIEN